MNQTWLDQNRNLVFGLLSATALIGASIFYFGQSSADSIEVLVTEPTATVEATPTATAPPPTPTPAPVRVYITGAVAKSDVYILPHGSIIKDAIEAAGGLTTEADSERVNQALELKDQQQIHIPRLGETDAPPPVQGGQSSAGPDNTETVDSSQPAASGGVINLNAATLEQLDSLPGVGPAIAQRIINYRETVGEFSSTEEITQVSGIGTATFTKIKHMIVVE